MTLLTTCSETSARAATAEILGIETRYRDAGGVMREVPAATVAAIAESLTTGMDAALSNPCLIVRRGDALPPTALEIRTEAGVSMNAGAAVTRAVPFGYHTLVDRDGTERQLIVSPGRCHLPSDLRGWGVAVQLYAARSSESWGMGDLGDLATVSRWASERDARFVLINPIHAPLMTPHQEPSPYFASSRLFRNPLFLRISDIDGLERLGDRAAEWRRRGEALNTTDYIDRDAVWALKREALNTLWAITAPSPAFDAFCVRGGATLQDYARFCVLTETHGPHWRSWPAEYRDRGHARVEAFARENADRVRFHQWLQWLIEQQLGAAQPEGLAIMHDLAVGVNPDGADCWMHPEVFVDGFSVGAPPDRFNTLGQNWAQPPFNPFRLRNAGFGPFIEMFRSIFAGGAAVRIDHIMGLFRLWWVPAGSDPTEGAYVRYPARELLDLLALESRRARAIVVGEDLGTVERGVRPELRRRNILNYRLVVFGGNQPLQRYPQQSMTAVTTHDLPTIAGLWTRSDVAAQCERHLNPNEVGTEATRQRLADLTGADATTSLADVVVRTHDALTQAPARLISAALDDLALSELRPNMPGTVPPTWPNWEIPLPAPLESVLASPVAERVAAALRAR